MTVKCGSIENQYNHMTVKYATSPIFYGTCNLPKSYDSKLCNFTDILRCV